MKKVLFLMALAAAQTVGAQQLANTTFDATWVDCYPWEAGSTISTSVGTQPNGWCIANVNGMNGTGKTIVGSEGIGRSGKSVVLTNTPNPYRSSEIVPGYMTLGTTWATAKASLTGVSNADGGTFGGISFSYHPDAIHLYYKRAHQTNSTSKPNTTEKASIIAYSWKGTWTQKDVPSNTKLYVNPDQVTMTDRDRNVLFNTSGTVGGDITSTNDAELIASIEYYIEGNASDWTELVIPFTYKTSSTPEKFNIIIAADDYFAARSNIGGYNQLTVDDVELLYYSELASCTYNNSSVSFTNKTATIEAIHDANKQLDITSNGHGATIEQSMDEELQLLTITIKGEDIKVNTSNFNTYTIQFNDAVLSNLSYNGATISGFSKSTTSYDLSSVFYDESKLSYSVEGTKTVTKSYDALTGILTITVTGTNSVTEYTIQFKVLSGPQVVSSKTYTEDLYVTLAGNTFDKEPAAVIVERCDDGTINFLLKNFVLSALGMPVGNIAVENIAVAEDNSFAFEGDIQLTAGDDPTYEEWAGPELTSVCGGGVPINLSGRFVGEDHVVVYIGIDITSVMGPDMGDVKVHLGYERYTPNPMVVNADAKYGTFCVPYVVDIPEGVQAYTVPSVNDRVLDLVELTGTIPANTPVVLYAESGYSSTEVFGYVDERAPIESLLTGVYESTSAPVGSYVLQNLEKIGFYKVIAGSQPTVGANRCYLTVPSSVKEAYFLNEDDATSISEISEKTEGAEAIYNLAGQRISKMQKGINIVNGKKVLY